MYFYNLRETKNNENGSSSELAWRAEHVLIVSERRRAEELGLGVSSVRVNGRDKLGSTERPESGAAQRAVREAAARLVSASGANANFGSLPSLG